MQRSVVALVAFAVLLISGACGPQDAPVSPVSGPAAGVVAAPAAVEVTTRPNIVFVLVDDLSMDLLPTLRSARIMSRQGASFENSFVVDSLCCVSRATTFTGQYPHQTRVRTNTAQMPNRVGPLGGWWAFRHYGNGARQFSVNLQQAGYYTGFIGKYLNEYEPHGRRQELPPLPMGWSDFRAVFGSAYDGWDFTSTQVVDGELTLVEHPAPPASARDRVKDQAYAGTMITREAIDFLRSRRASDQPFFLEIAPYAPHSRVSDKPAYHNEPLFPAALRDRPGGRHQRGNCGILDCRDLTVASLPGFHDRRIDNRPVSADGSRAPNWNKRPVTLTRKQAENNLRDRARMAQSVDRMVRRILKLVDDNTYVVFTSDNGYHLGQMGLLRGKGTAYDTDTRVPLLVVGPGVVPGARTGMVSNLDLASTFEAIAGVPSPDYRSGVSLLPNLLDPLAPEQDYVYFEHTFARSFGDDPDRAFTGGGLNVIPSYVAVRSRTGLLIRNDLDRRWGHVDYAYEFYDYTTQAWERINQYGVPAAAPQVVVLMNKLAEYDACAGVRADDPVPAQCRALTLETSAVLPDVTAG